MSQLEGAAAGRRRSVARSLAPCAPRQLLEEEVLEEQVLEEDRASESVPGGGGDDLRLLAGPSAASGPETFASHLGRLGDRPSARGRGRRSGLTEEIARSGLRGRGGGGFPLAQKMSAVAAARGRPVIVANGTEGEPESAKDRVLMAHRPHLVLDGVVLAAEILGADVAHICIGQRAREAISAMEGAISERKGRDLGDISVRVEVVPDLFVGGEETALVSRLGRGSGKPRLSPPYVAQSGLGRRPTLVSNVETLGHLALIARHGGGWFASVGDPEEPGTRLVTMAGAMGRPGVREVATDASMDDLLNQSQLAPRTQAVLVGGYFGTWVHRGSVEGSTFSRRGLAHLGAGPGAGVIYGLAHSVCGVAETARIVTWLASQSSGQCGPCVHGLGALADGMTALARPGGANVSLLRRLARWSSDVEGRGACSHPDGVVHLVRSALAAFADEIGRHIDGACQGDRSPLAPIGAGFGGFG